jgi:hypothetical protein
MLCICFVLAKEFKFVGYDIKDSHSRHVSICLLRNNILYNIRKYMYDLFLYQILHAWLQWFISYHHQTYN